jgi:hypothetical protein
VAEAARFISEYQQARCKSLGDTIWGMSSMWRWLIAILFCAVASDQRNTPPSEVAGIPVNYDESKVGKFTLPDPLVLADGNPVRDARTWTEKRRPEIVRLFEEDQYGRSPGARPKGGWLVYTEPLNRAGEPKMEIPE